MVDNEDGLVADLEPSWLLVNFWRDFELTWATESFKELTTKEQLEKSTADSTFDELDVWLQRSDGHSGLSELMTTVDETTDVSLHDERDKKDSKELIDKSFFFKEMISVFKFKVWKDGDECSNVWTNSLLSD